MKSLSNNLLFIVLLSLFCFGYILTPLFYHGENSFLSKEYRLWLDLQGWVELDYKVDLDQVRKEPGYNNQRENSILEWLKSIVDRRVEALKINDSVITTASYGGEKHIIVQIPMKGKTREENNLNIKKAKEAIGRVMRIEFKEKRGEITPADLEERKELSQTILWESQKLSDEFGVLQSKYSDSYENVSFGSLSGTTQELSEYFTLSGTDLQPGVYGSVLSGTWVGQLVLNNWNFENQSNAGYWILDIKEVTDGVIDFDYIFVDAKPSDWKPAMDSKGRILNDKYFVNSSVQYNQAFQPMVELTFNDEGAQIFGELTKRLKGKQIAIFVGGDLLTAPNVNDVILTGKAVITGTYTPKEAQKLASDINTWVVPAPIYLTSERSIDSKIGANSLLQLIDAWVYGFLMIVVFLMLVYRVGGILSAVALLIYVAIMLMLSKVLGIVLTLAWIAGLILSVGMAIDANILIFERIHDALRDGKNRDKAIVEWFDQSWSAIWDGHVTGIISAIILFIFWVNMIKWFGLMLGIWLIVSLFSAMFISRLFILLTMKHTKLSDVWLFGYKSKKE